MSLRAILARNLRRLRAERGLSQEGLALEAGIDRGYVGHIERRNYSVSLDILEKLAVALKTEPQLLLTPQPQISNRRSKPTSGK